MKEKDKNKIKFYITPSALKIIESFKQLKKSDKESGGVLLGQIRDHKIFILKVSIPNIFDKASRHSFDCNKDAAQLIINYEFKNSCQKTIYLGEWHTHPENYPNPSTVDKRMINNQYFKNKLNEPFLVLIIQGLKELYIAIYDGKKLEKTNIIIIDD